MSDKATSVAFSRTSTSARVSNTLFFGQMQGWHYTICHFWESPRSQLRIRGVQHRLRQDLLGLRWCLSLDWYISWPVQHLRRLSKSVLVSCKHKCAKEIASGLHQGHSRLRELSPPEAAVSLLRTIAAFHAKPKISDKVAIHLCLVIGQTDWFQRTWRSSKSLACSESSLCCSLARSGLKMKNSSQNPSESTWASESSCQIIQNIPVIVEAGDCILERDLRRDALS